MKYRKVLLLAIFVVFFIPNRCIASQDYLPNVIVIVLNGVRNQDSIDDPTHQYIPLFWGKMLKEGTLYTHLYNLNNPFHMPSVQAMVSGRVHYAYEYVSAPTIFEYVEKRYNMPRDKMWCIGNWFERDCEKVGNNKYHIDIIDTFLNISDIHNLLFENLSKQEITFVDHFRKDFVQKKKILWPHWDSFSNILYYHFFRKIIRIFKPKLLFYMLGDPETAHYGSFSMYTLALKSADEKVYDVWRIIQNDNYYEDNTYLMIVIDNGRNSYYAQHNNLHYDLNKGYKEDRVWMFIYGPRIKKGKIINRPIYHVDIFATIAYLMKVKVPEDRGDILYDCFVN